MLCAQFFEKDAVARCGRLHGIPNDTPIRSWDEISVLEMPTLVFGNTPDLVHPLAFAMEWAQRLPRGEFVQTPSRTLDFEPACRGRACPPQDVSGRSLAVMKWASGSACALSATMAALLF